MHQHRRRQGVRVFGIHARAHSPHTEHISHIMFCIYEYVYVMHTRARADVPRVRIRSDACVTTSRAPRACTRVPRVSCTRSSPRLRHLGIALCVGTSPCPPSEALSLAATRSARARGHAQHAHTMHPRVCIAPHCSQLLSRRIIHAFPPRSRRPGSPLVWARPIVSMSDAISRGNQP